MRRQFETLPWPEALRVTGLSVTTYRGALAGELGPGPEPAGTDESAPERSAADEKYLFWRVLQAERDTPAGIALWLSNQLGASLEEIAALTWDQVDLGASVLRLPDRVLPLTAGTRRVLWEASARRRPGEDPHVILTPRSRAPMDAARLTTLMRGALVRGGLGNHRPMEFRKDAAVGDAPRLLELVRANGSLSRAEAAERRGLSMAQADDRLRKLEAAGELVLLKNRWWPAETAVAPREREEAVLRCIAEHGPAASGEIASRLRVARRTAASLLGAMVRSGDLSRQGRERRYALTEQGARKITKA